MHRVRFPAASPTRGSDDPQPGLTKHPSPFNNCPYAVPCSLGYGGAGGVRCAPSPPAPTGAGCGGGPVWRTPPPGCRQGALCRTALPGSRGARGDVGEGRGSPASFPLFLGKHLLARTGRACAERPGWRGRGGGDERGPRPRWERRRDRSAGLLLPPKEGEGAVPAARHPPAGRQRKGPGTGTGRAATGEGGAGGVAAYGAAGGSAAITCLGWGRYGGMAAGSAARPLATLGLGCAHPPTSPLRRGRPRPREACSG